MDNGDATQGHAMTPEEFAKLMGAYPQPAENPLPAYGGYMDNSPANFSFVEFNDYFGAESWSETDQYTIEYLLGYNMNVSLTDRVREMVNDEDIDLETLEWFLNNMEIPLGDKEEALEIITEAKGAETFESEWVVEAVQQNLNDENFVNSAYTVLIGGDAKTVEEKSMAIAETMNQNANNESFTSFVESELFNAETFEAPYGGAGSLMDIGKATPLADFTDEELTTSSAIHGDFDQASLNYSGHQNIEVRAEGDLQGYSEGQYLGDDYIITDTRKGVTFVVGAFEVVQERENRDDEAVMVKFALPVEDFIHRLQGSSMTNNTGFITIERDIYDAEMEMIDESNARIRNRFNDEIGMVSVDDHDVEDAVVEVSDGSDVIQEVIVSDAETKKSSILPFVIGGVAAVFAFPKVTEFFTKKEEKAADTPEMGEIELIENPNTGNLDPAQYEEMVVESTGFAVDVIPQVLDGSFMGSRFQALPTERYVEYNEPGIGAHTDIALNRDEIYLEPEMTMVQASENVIKEAQAPGQSPYNSTTGEENPDFDMRVLKETQVISLDPAVKPFIPQSMSGYTGNANTPPSVLNKMFNTGVLGQTPAFVPGSGDMGANHLGSRNATPNTLGLGGSVGGPLSDQVNANYTDGTTSMSLAQWAIENTVSQTSDTEAVVIDRSSGLMKRVRRV